MQMRWTVSSPLTLSLSLMKLGVNNIWARGLYKVTERILNICISYAN